MGAGMESVRVTGSGQVETPPDAAVLNLGTEAWARSVGQALAAASGALREMTGALRNAGVIDQDLRTEGPSTYARPDGTGRIAGYACSFHLTARLTNPASAGQLVADAVGRAGDAGRVFGIRYVVTDSRSAQRDARALAFADALSRAEQLGALVGRPLGRAIEVLEEDTDVGWHSERMLSLASEASAGEPGVQRIGVRVQVRWAFAD